MTRRHGPFATHKPWKPIGAAMAIGVTTATVLVGFVVLPLANRQAGEPLWTAICTAFGLRGATPAALVEPPLRFASTVRWTAETVAAVDAAAPPAGADLAQTCAACHGDDGISGSNWLPSLAGMPREALVKQLADFRSGHRRWPVMNAIAAALSPEAMREVAAFYASLPPAAAIESRNRLGGDELRSADPIVRLVYAGDPARGIAPCASCHGLEGRKRAAPILAGQHTPYLVRQLDAFRRGVRNNDEGEQMRVIAATLNNVEIDGLARYLSGNTP